MADQPLNTAIHIFRTVRSQREYLRGDSIKNLTGHLRKLILVVPGSEFRTQYNGRTTTVTDFSPFMGHASAGATRGLPVTVGLQAQKDLKAMVGLNAPTLVGVVETFQIGADKFVQEQAASVGGDLFAEASAAAPIVPPVENA